MSDDATAIESFRKENLRLTGELNQAKEALEELRTLIYEAHSMTTRAVNIFHGLGYVPWGKEKSYSR